MFFSRFLCSGEKNNNNPQMQNSFSGTRSEIKEEKGRVEKHRGGLKANISKMIGAHLWSFYLEGIKIVSA